MRYLIVLLLAGCATTQPQWVYTPPTYIQIDYSRKPPSDWPVLETKVQYGEMADIRRWCSKTATEANKDKLVACAIPYFEWGMCMIFLSGRDPAWLDHEEAHCRGYGHVGDRVNYQAQAWEAFKAKRK